MFGAEVAFAGYSDSAVSANGTEITARNHNRNKSDVSKTKLFISPTVTNIGTKIITAVSYATNSQSKVAIADTEILSRYILKRGSSNILRLTNRDNNQDAKISLILDFLEVEI